MLTELGRPPVEVQQCSLRSDPGGGGSGGGPVVLTALGPWRLRSRGAHCDRTLAVEVPQCSLHSGAGEEEWREAWRRGLARRIGEEDWRGGLARRLAKRIGEKVGKEYWRGEGGEEGGRAALIKPSNPHLAGSENDFRNQ